MKKLRVFLNWLEDIAYSIYISFHTTEGKDSDSNRH